MREKTGQAGFTLVEIIMVVAILGIIATIGTTSLMNYLPNMRLKSATRDIFSAMMQAKVEAIKRGENATILFNFAGNSYTMFLDRGSGIIANNDNEAVDPGEIILLIATPLPDRVSFDPNLVINGNPHVDGISFVNNSLIFSPRGIPAGAAGGIGGGTIGLRATDAQGNSIRQRTVTVSTAGRINMD